ncbi:diacylglycerol kinase family protein [Anaerorhabdus sp.]|uniref:diacylglycerol kinase family protein n=1 Tax=Anaerorhabdus sp. TaxID=1872524 RepID=UPI002B21E4DE|nr:diacylglycerol kinase family protein [Anaerorhabdus sp.]MEA4874112.1 diacylglycerol kinase family protein [Anaerorhabdus sp.]
MNKFRVAFDGLYQALRHQSVFVQFVFMIFALIASFVFKFTYLENLILGLCIGLVIVTEIINTCIEKICDFMSPETDERIKLIKDMSAGAVLFAALVSLILGLMMVINHL